MDRTLNGLLQLIRSPVFVFSYPIKHILVSQIICVYVFIAKPTITLYFLMFFFCCIYVLSVKYAPIMCNDHGTAVGSLALSLFSVKNDFTDCFERAGEKKEQFK